MEKFSYSKIEVYNKCPFKYKLHYVDGHYIFYNTVATEFGTLVHYIEECIGNDLKNGVLIDYDKYLKIFFDGNEDVVGAKALKSKYSSEWDIKNKDDMSYEDKMNSYSTIGIYRLESYLKEHTNLSVYATELKVKFTYNEKLFEGSIDRVFYDSLNNCYIIEDIKTYTKKLMPSELKKSLQMFVYTMALRDSLSIFEKDIEIKCAYDLPLINMRQSCTVDMDVVSSNLNESFVHIETGDFHPVPSPLCHWCEFCNTNPNQPEEGKNLCPYHSKWTKENKTFSVENKWQGESKHPLVLKEWLNKLGGNNTNVKRKDERFKLRIRG